MFRATLIAMLSLAGAALIPTASRAEIISLECSGDVTGTFTIDLSGGTVATYEDNRTIDLTEVAISESTIAFSEDNKGSTDPTVQTPSAASQFSIDRQTNKIEKLTYEYFGGKVTGTSREVGQCKRVPNPQKPL